MGSPSRSRSSKHTSRSSGSKRKHRSKSRSPERDYRRDRRSSPRSRSSRSSSKHKSSSRRRYRSSSSSSYSSDSRDYKRSASPEQKPVKKPQEKAKAIPEPEVKVFESVNFLHEKDKKVDLDELEQEAFVPKTFSSSKKPELGNIIVNLDTQTVLVPEAKKPPPEDSLLHYGLFGDDEARMEKWVKKLYNYRQKAALGDV